MTNREAAIKVIGVLRKAGFEALLAGGCVRDRLLGLRPKDYDVATSAEPADVVARFSHTIKVGAKFGVIIVRLGGQQVEVATFRSDVGYEDGRRPSRIEFTNAKQDALRRDFTVNGMFYDPIKRTVVDYVGGQRDLQARIIRAIGRPQERFTEDYLRMLRAIRFGTRLGFAIAPTTYAAIGKNAERIVQISGERIAIELQGILMGLDRIRGLEMLIDTGLADHIFPGMISEQHQAALQVLGQLSRKSSFCLTLAGWFVGCDTNFALQGLKRLKLSRHQTKHIKFLLMHRGKLLCNTMTLAQVKLIASEAHFADLYEMQRAIQRANQSSIAPLIRLRQRIKALAGTELRPAPLLDGHALIRLGAATGPAVGQLSQALYLAQLEGVVKTKKDAEVWAKKWIDERKRS
jgi:poly(A) polymerase